MRWNVSSLGSARLLTHGRSIGEHVENDASRIADVFIQTRLAGVLESFNYVWGKTRSRSADGTINLHDRAPGKTPAGSDPNLWILIGRSMDTRVSAALASPICPSAMAAAALTQESSSRSASSRTDTERSS